MATIWRRFFYIGRGRGSLVKEPLKICFLLAFFLFLCEIAIYPIVLFQCSWPALTGSGIEGEKVVKAMVLADTHLLGPYYGHWFDKLRREWQMHRAFQTAVGMFQPEVIFFLGDLFDEGEWVNQKGFNTYVSRFEELFYVPENIGVYVVAGNHDIGFHYKSGVMKNSRFHDAFNSTSVRLINLKGVNFLMINSMAMEMDGCTLCKEAVEQLTQAEERLYCQKNPQSSECLGKKATAAYSQPILLQHFPLYRESDSICSGEDSAPETEKYISFRPSVDCLTKESSEVLLSSMKPRLILSGHTHHYCNRTHIISGSKPISEYSVPSFSWRNRNDPSFFLGHFSASEFHLSKCLMPKESVVMFLYGLGGVLIFLVIVRWAVIFSVRVFRSRYFPKSD